MKLLEILIVREYVYFLFARLSVRNPRRIKQKGTDPISGSYLRTGPDTPLNN